MAEPRDSNREQFEYFVAWTLAPNEDKADDEKTMEMLSVKLDISCVTFNKWAKSRAFIEQSNLCRRGLAQLRRNQLEAAAYAEAMREGWQEKAFFMKCFGDWTEKTETTHKVLSLTALIEAEKLDNKQVIEVEGEEVKQIEEGEKE